MHSELIARSFDSCGIRRLVIRRTLATWRGSMGLKCVSILTTLLPKQAGNKKSLPKYKGCHDTTQQPCSVLKPNRQVNNNTYKACRKHDKRKSCSAAKRAVLQHPRFSLMSEA